MNLPASVGALESGRRRPVPAQPRRDELSTVSVGIDEAVDHLYQDGQTCCHRSDDGQDLDALLS